MLSLFPSLLSYSQFSPFIIRITLGVILVYFAYKAFRDCPQNTKAKIIGVVEGISGILISIGLWTQLAALIIAIDLVIRLADRIRNKSFLTDGVNYYLLLLVLALSLLVTGAGKLAFDLPL